MIPIVFSTITGNAFKIAEAAAKVIPDHVGPYNIRYVNKEMIDKFDTFVLSYWCNHGTTDDDTIELLRHMHGKKIIIIGTLGAARESAHAQKVCQNVEALVQEQNELPLPVPGQHRPRPHRAPPAHTRGREGPPEPGAV